MKSILKIKTGAAKRCGKGSLFQWLSPRCGRSSTFEAKRLFSLAPAPFIAAVLAALVLLPDRGASACGLAAAAATTQSLEMENENLPTAIPAAERTIARLIHEYKTDPYSARKSGRVCTHLVHPRSGACIGRRWAATTDRPPLQVLA